MAVQRDEAATKKGLAQVEDRLTGRIDRVEQSLSAKIDANSAKIDANGASIDRLIVQVTKNGEAIKETLTREEYKKDYNELLRGQDEMMVVLLRIDQERAATNSRIDRVEGDVETNKSEIKRIKTKLAMDT